MPTGTPKYFSFPFGIDGDLLAIPDPTQVGGSLSYEQGFGPDYALIDTDPSSLTIPRNQFNQMMFDVTSTLQQLYQNGFPLFITSAMNDGVPFSYSKNAYVYQPADGNVYYSNVNANTDVPPSSKWQLIAGATSYFNAATDTGTANHYVIAPAPAMGSPVAGNIIILQPVNANTGACDINVSGHGALAIKTLVNQNPAAGMLIPTGTYFLSFNAVTGFWVLLNPTLGTAAYATLGTANGNVPVLNNVAAAAYKIVLGSITIQGGFSPSSAGANPTITFATPFSATPYDIQLTGCGFGTGVTIALSGSTPVVSALSFGTQTFDTDEQGGTNPRNFYWRAIGPT